MSDFRVFKRAVAGLLLLRRVATDEWTAVEEKDEENIVFAESFRKQAR